MEEKWNHSTASRRRKVLSRYVATSSGVVGVVIIPHIPVLLVCGGDGFAMSAGAVKSFRFEVADVI